MRLTLAPKAGLLVGFCSGLGCFTGQRPQPLAEFPPVELQVLMSTRNLQGASATFNIITQDPNKCPKLSDGTQADINGRSLPLLDAGGALTRKGGASYCEPPHFDGSDIPLAGDAAIRVHDATAEFAIDAPGALRAVSATLVQPSTGVLTPGQSVQLVLAPSIGTVTHATVAFLPASGGAAAFSAEYPASTGALSSSGDMLSFVVPATAPAGAGSLQVAATLAVAVSRCSGPAICTVQMGMGSTLAASVGGP